jgi:hypothetical protein
MIQNSREDKSLKNFPGLCGLLCDGDEVFAKEDILHAISFKYFTS